MSQLVPWMLMFGLGTIQVRLVSFLGFEAWLLFKLNVPHVWRETKLQLPLHLFKLVGDSNADEISSWVNKIIQWVPFWCQLEELRVHATMCRLRSDSLRKQLASTIRSNVRCHDLPDIEATLMFALWGPRQVEYVTCANNIKAEGLVVTRALMGGRLEASLVQLTTLLPISRREFSINFTNVDNPNLPEDDAFRHHAEVHLGFANVLPAAGGWPGQEICFNNVLDDIDYTHGRLDCRDTRLSVQLQLSSNERLLDATLTVTKQGQKSRKDFVANNVIEDASVWFILRINCSSADTWQIVVEV